HTNVGDPLAYACRLARKAYASGRSLVVLAQSERLAAFDEQLWTFAPLEFVPHCMAKSPLAQDTPLVLASDLDDLPHHQVLVNLRVHPWRRPRQAGIRARGGRQRGGGGLRVAARRGTPARPCHTVSEWRCARGHRSALSGRAARAFGEARAGTHARSVARARK